MLASELRALADKVEQGTATKENVCDGAFPYEVRNGRHYYIIDGSRLSIEYAPDLLTSIDAQMKYLPMPGHVFTILSRDDGVWQAALHPLDRDRYDPNSTWSYSAEEPAARLAAILRAMAWEKENGNA